MKALLLVLLLFALAACNTNAEPSLRSTYCDRYIKALEYGVDSDDPDALSVSIDRLNALWHDAYENGDDAFEHALDDFLIGASQLDDGLYWDASARLDDLCGWS